MQLEIDGYIFRSTDNTAQVYLFNSSHPLMPMRGCQITANPQALALTERAEKDHLWEVFKASGYNASN